MRVAIAGGTGFIGRQLGSVLRASGHEVVVISRRRGADLRLDVTAPLPVDALAGCDAVVNLVGIKCPQGRNTFEAVHVDAPFNLARAARSAGARRLVHVSVVDAGRDPADPYMRTKGDGEDRVRREFSDATVVRPSVVYGPGDDMLFRLVRGIRWLPVFPVPHPVGPLRPVDVRDVGDAIAATLADPATAGRSYDVAGPESVTLPELAHRVAAALGRRIVCPRIPRALLLAAAAIAESLPWDPPITRSQARMLSAGLEGDPVAARVELGVQGRLLDTERIREVAATMLHGDRH